MQQDTEFIEYLKLFFVAWQRAYKIGWIFYALEEKLGVDALSALRERATRLQYPLFPLLPHHYYVGTTFFTSSCSRQFSDWLFDKSPTEESFLRSVLQSAHALKANEQKFKTVRRNEKRLEQANKNEARDAFGGEVVSLRFGQLRYSPSGRTTGFAQPVHLPMRVANPKRR